MATVEDVDKAVRYGPGLRWAVMGPHLIYHLGGGPGGIRGHISHLTGTKEGMLRDLATWTTFPPDTADVLAAGVEAEVRGKTLVELEGERDEALAAVLLARRARDETNREEENMGRKKNDLDVWIVRSGSSAEFPESQSETL